MSASNGTPRYLKRERRNVVVRVWGCKMTKIQAYLYRGWKYKQEVSFSGMLVLKKDWAERKLY